MASVKAAQHAGGPDGVVHLRHASKGRMANYDVQDKLVHFMAPDDHPVPCDWNLDELFSNLFGGVGKLSAKSGS